jgi:competence protein ComEC
MVLVGIVAAFGAASAVADLEEVTTGPYAGDAILVTDPEWRRGATHVILDIDGERFRVSAGNLAGRRLARARMGDLVAVEGERAVAQRRSYDVAMHVKGRFTASEVAETVRAGAPLHRAANALRTLLGRAADHMPPNEAGLYLGLVVGDDRGQSPAMVESFRASGLSHLTAVSGQNVAFLLAALAPLLTRTRTWWRVGLTAAFLVWFVVVTRAEPSVIRAAASAAVSAVAFARGADVSGRRMLALAMFVLLIVDPLLAWSVGFWMSVAATAGLVTVSSQLHDMLRGPEWFRTALATTIGAQVAVAPIALVVFGRVSLTAVATNLIAVPIAGAVMFVGLPLGLVVGVADTFLSWWPGVALGTLGEAAMAPVAWAVRFVWWVAVVGSLQQ